MRMRSSLVEIELRRIIVWVFPVRDFTEHGGALGQCGEVFIVEDQNYLAVTTP